MEEEKIKKEIKMPTTGTIPEIVVSPLSFLYGPINGRTFNEALTLFDGSLE